MSDSRGTASGPGGLDDDPAGARVDETGERDAVRDDAGDDVLDDRFDDDVAPEEDAASVRPGGTGVASERLRADGTDHHGIAQAQARGAAGGGSVAVRAGRATTARRGPVTRVRSIGTFYRQVVAELRKVIWPTRQELITYTSVVIVFVVVMVLIVSIFDFAFSKAVLKVFGDSSL